MRCLRRLTLGTLVLLMLLAPALQASGFNWFWSHNILFKLPYYGTTVAFAQDFYLDRFAWDTSNATKITFYNIKMDGDPISQISFSVQQANITVTQLYVSKIITIQALAIVGITSTIQIETYSLGKPGSILEGGSAAPNSAYDVPTSTVTVQLTHSTSVVTLTLDFNTGSTGPSTGGGGSPTGGFDFTLDAANIQVSKGSTLDFNLSFSWSGADSARVTKLVVDQQYMQWITLSETLPKIVTRGAGMDQGKGDILLLASGPWDVTEGKYTIPIQVSVEQAGVSGGEATRNGVIYLTIEARSLNQGGIPEYMTWIFLVALAAIAAAAFLKRR